MDFTIKVYKTLLSTLKNQGFSFLPFSDYLLKPETKVIMLRHDVDKLPVNSLVFATIQNKLGIKGSYYFRAVPESWNESIIRKIEEMGHEIGYHYEDVSSAAGRLREEGGGQRGKTKGIGNWNYEEEEYERYLAGIAIESFRENLEKLRKIVPIKTICMHGSPMSNWDSRLLWKYYDYRDFGISGEPYFDIDFNEVLYLTDTGRRWNGNSVNIRDKSINHKVQKGAEKGLLSSSNAHSFSMSFRSTNNIINAAENGIVPDKIMMTFHPQRWSSKVVPWIKELVWQNVKNVGKYFLVKMKN